MRLARCDIPAFNQPTQDDDSVTHLNFEPSPGVHANRPATEQAVGWRASSNRTKFPGWMG